jgi:hypothetical protein
VAALVAAVVACAGEGAVTDGGGGTLAGEVQPILNQNCAISGCHVGATPPPQPQGMNLAQGLMYGNTVNVASTELPTMDRIEPSQPDMSYLIHKIQGTHLGIGGTGQRMPLGGAPLTQEQIDAIRTWVSAGAPNN